MNPQNPNSLKNEFCGLSWDSFLVVWGSGGPRSGLLGVRASWGSGAQLKPPRNQTCSLVEGGFRLIDSQLTESKKFDYLIAC